MIIHPNTGLAREVTAPFPEVEELHVYSYMFDEMLIPTHRRISVDIGALNEHEQDINWFINQAHKVANLIPPYTKFRFKVDETFYKMEKHAGLSPWEAGHEVLPLYREFHGMVDPIEPWPAVRWARMRPFLDVLREADIKRFYLDLDLDHYERTRPPWWKFWTDWPAEYLRDLRQMRCWSDLHGIELFVILGSPMLLRSTRDNAGFVASAMAQYRFAEEFICPDRYVVQSWEPEGTLPDMATMLKVGEWVDSQ